MTDRASWAVGRYATEGGEFPNVWAGFIPRWLEWLLISLAAVCLAVEWVTRPVRRLWRLLKGGNA